MLLLQEFVGCFRWQLLETDQITTSGTSNMGHPHNYVFSHRGVTFFFCRIELAIIQTVEWRVEG